MNKVIQILAIITMILGAGGTIICVPFALASDFINIVGAGFGIMIGAVLWGAGLITLAIHYKSERSD